MFWLPKVHMYFISVYKLVDTTFQQYQVKARSKNIILTNRKVKIHTIRFVSIRIIITSNCNLINFNCIDLNIPEQFKKVLKKFKAFKKV